MVERVRDLLERAGILGLAAAVAVGIAFVEVVRSIADAVVNLIRNGDVDLWPFFAAALTFAAVVVVVAWIGRVRGPTA